MRAKKGAVDVEEDLRLNDFVMRFANVNGTGSASANGLISKAMFRMGIPVGPKNMFPSNIQGFPTWYEIRVSHKGYTGRRGGVDLVIAMNPQSFAKDEASVSSGGYLIYDEARYQVGHTRREDIQYLPLPLTHLAQGFPPGNARSMLKNIIYAGALTSLLDIEKAVVEQLLGEAYGRKPNLLEANFRALELGRKVAEERFDCPLPIRVKRLDLNQGKILA